MAKQIKLKKKGKKMKMPTMNVNGVHVDIFIFNKELQQIISHKADPLYNIEEVITHNPHQGYPSMQNVGKSAFTYQFCPNTKSIKHLLKTSGGKKLLPLPGNHVTFPLLFHLGEGKYGKTGVVTDMEDNEYHTQATVILSAHKTKENNRFYNLSVLFYPEAYSDDEPAFVDFLLSDIHGRQTGLKSSR